MAAAHPLVERADGVEGIRARRRPSSGSRPVACTARSPSLVSTRPSLFKTALKYAMVASGGTCGSDQP